jgi:hypothetical protein
MQGFFFLKLMFSHFLSSFISWKEIDLSHLARLNVPSIHLLYLSQNTDHDELRNIHSCVYSSFMSLERFTTLVLLISEGVVER